MFRFKLWGRRPRYQLNGRSEVPKAGLVVVERIHVSCVYQESNPISWVVQPQFSHCTYRSSLLLILVTAPTSLSWLVVLVSKLTGLSRLLVLFIALTGLSCT
jgi:hypothetical protein